MFNKSLMASVALATFVSAASKRGVAWPWFNEGTSLDASIFGDGCGDVAHIYNWETWAPSKPGQLNFIGTQRCMDCESSPISQLATRAKEQGWTDLFTLNEPEFLNVSPSDAATWWKEHINPLEGINRATPGVTNSGAPGQGLDWLKQFFDSCGEQCKHELINIHWYGASFNDFKNYVEEVHEKFPGEYITITEFSLTGEFDAAAQAAFFKEAIPYLDEIEYVDTYFPFVATSPSLLKKYHEAAYDHVGTGACLLNDDGALSLVGNVLAAVV